MVTVDGMPYFYACIFTVKVDPPLRRSALQILPLPSPWSNNATSYCYYCYLLPCGHLCLGPPALPRRQALPQGAYSYLKRLAKGGKTLREREGELLCPELYIIIFNILGTTVLISAE